MKVALYYERLQHKKVHCHLCPHECLIAEGKIGICMGKKNIEGALFAKNYSQTTSLALDPIEKKPLYHFFPGSNILSIGPNGCNLSCKFCQNWQISQKIIKTSTLSPEDAVDTAIQCKALGIAYTYSEPLIWYEYILDTAAIAKKKGIKNVLVTSGYINEEPLKRLLPLIDAMNVDIKSMDDIFYKRECGATLEPVLRTVELAAGVCHVEITNLVIPTLNDADHLFHKLADWLASINPDIPLHFSRYSPCYKESIPATPDETLVRALDIASNKIHYVYVGNSPMKKWSDTRCHNCGETIISRYGFSITSERYKDARCDFCGEAVPLINHT